MNRLKFLRNERNESLEKIADYLNVTLQTISNYENEKRDMTPSTIIKLAEYFDVSIDYLLCKSDSRNPFNNAQYYMCPVYGQISAGQPNWAGENIEGRIPIDPNLMNIVNPEEHFFLRVNGESMNKIVKNGAFALIHKQDTVNNGEIAAVLVNGYNATLKRFSKEGDIIVLTPESTDESIKQQIYTKDTPIKVIGKYVGKMELN